MKISSVTLLLGTAFVLGVLGNYLLTLKDDGKVAEAPSLFDAQPLDLALAPTAPTPRVAQDDSAGRPSPEDVQADWGSAPLPAEDVPPQPTADLAQQEPDVQAAANPIESTTEQETVAIDKFSAGFGPPTLATDETNEPETNNEPPPADPEPVVVEASETPDTPLVVADEQETFGPVSSIVVEQFPAEETEAPITTILLTDKPQAESAATANEFPLEAVEQVASDEPQFSAIESVLVDNPVAGGEFPVEAAEQSTGDETQSPDTGTTVAADNPPAGNELPIEAAEQSTGDGTQSLDTRTTVAADSPPAGSELAIEDVEPIATDEPQSPDSQTVASDNPAPAGDAVITDAPSPADVASNPNVSVDETNRPEPVTQAEVENTAENTAENAVEPNAESEPVQAVAIEIFRERHPDGSLKIEREVTLDEKLNYVSHGLHRQWNKAGTLTAEGRWEYGRREGLWKREFKRNESDLFSREPFTLFSAPFVSTATFRDGRLHGKWTIEDSENRVVSEIDFVDGVRHGSLLHYYPSGSKMREIAFRDGLVDGHLRDFTEDGAVIREHKYLNGNYFSTQVESYASTTKKAETNLLHPRMTIKSPDDWWNARLAEYGREEGEPVQHGLQTVWYETGQLRFRGQFDHGRAVGEFTWWLENGQISRKGNYVDGRQHGEWSWWHANGAKSVLGNYDHGAPVGRWLFWKPDGELDQMKDLSSGAGSTVEGSEANRTRATEPALPENPTGSSA